MSVPVIASNGGGSTAAVSVPEGAGEILTVAATGSPTPAYSITAGADAALFAINSSTGVVTPVTALDFENPTDAGANNVYNFTVTATNIDGSDSQAITLTVTDLFEKVLNFVVMVEGEVIGLDTPPKLENPSASFGVTNIDTGDVLVDSATEFEAIGNAWTYTVLGPIEDATYRYYVKVFYNSVLYYIPRTTAYVTSACLVLGRYTNSMEIEQQFGVDNVHKWLAIDDHDEAEDYASKLYRFIRDAEAEIDDLLRGGPCDVPFDDDVPAIIKNIATALAGVKTYESRGVVDMNPETGQVQHRLQVQSKWVEKQIGRIKSGQMRLTADNVTRYPTVLNG